LKAKLFSLPSRTVLANGPTVHGTVTVDGKDVPGTPNNLVVTETANRCPTERSPL
jgi:hypothetical protein